MEQWIYARLYLSAIKILQEANEEFHGGYEISDDKEMYSDICEELNKTAFVLAKAIRNSMYKKGE